MRPWVKEIFQTGLFTPISLERGEFVLKGTEFTVVVRKNAVIWKKKMIRSRTSPTRTPGDPTPESWASVASGPRYVNCSFEEVFDNCPSHIRERMIYHLDVLNKGGMAFNNSRSIRGKSMDLVYIDEVVHFGDLNE